MQSPAQRPCAVVLLSGGLDSATALAIAARRDAMLCATLAIDYGQRHRHELQSAQRVSQHAGVTDHRVIRVDLRAFGGSALTADIDVPKDRAASTMDDIPITYVPARNLIFLSLATALAETLGASAIYLGVNIVDYSGYPDCRPEFVRSFEHAANLATKAGVEGRTLRVVSPLIAMSKRDIILVGVSLGVDYALTHSCYDPITRLDTTLACGRCDSCILRRDGFAAAKVPDPTRYAT